MSLKYNNKLEHLLINFKEWDWEKVEEFFRKKLLEKQNKVI